MSEYFFEKLASSSLSEAEDIMSEVYNENPSYWPHGLNKEAMDGGLYLIRQSNTAQPVGFVGWQDRYEDMRKVGYYSIGIKKEHRRKGFAKKAVAEIIRRKSATVDQVKAYIVDGNKPSINLAEKLEVPILLEKSAGIMRNLAGLGAGVAGIGAGGAAGGYFGDKVSDTAEFLDKNVKLNKLLNQAAGAALMAPALLLAPRIRSTRGMPTALAAMSGQNVVSWPMKEGLIGYKDTQDRHIQSQQELTDTNLETARSKERAAKIQEDTSNIYKDLISRYGSTALIGGGLLGLAAVIAMYRNNKGSSRGGPGVLSVDIPEQQMSEKFYRTLSRDLLFDSPKEKERKLKLLLENSGGDPMVQKMLANKSASFKKKLTSVDSGLTKSAGFLRSIPTLGRAGTKLKGWFNAVKAKPLNQSPILNAVKKVTPNYKNTFTKALPQTARGVAGMRGGNWAGKAIRNSALTNAGLNVGLMGLDKATGWDTAGTHRDWLFSPFRDAGSNWKKWWNASDAERDKNNYLGRAIGNSLWAPVNLVLGAGMGGSVARMGAWGARRAGGLLGGATRAGVNRFAPNALGSANILSRAGGGISNTFKGIDRAVLHTINSGQRLGAASGQGLARMFGMNPNSKLGAATSFLGGNTLTSPFEFFGKGHGLRAVYNQLARNLSAGKSAPQALINQVRRLGYNKNWWNNNLRGEGLLRSISPLATGKLGISNLASMVPHVGVGVAKNILPIVANTRLGVFGGAPAYHSSTGVDPNDPRLSAPSKFTRDYTNAANWVEDNIPLVGSWIPPIAGMLPGLPQKAVYGGDEGSWDTAFGVPGPDGRFDRGYAGRDNPMGAGGDPALLEFLRSHDAAQRAEAEGMSPTDAGIDPVVLRYPDTREGFAKWMEDKDNHLLDTSWESMKKHIGPGENQIGVVDAIAGTAGQKFMDLMGYNPHNVSQGLPTDARRKYRTKIWNAYLQRRQSQKAVKPIGWQGTPLETLIQHSGLLKHHQPRLK